MGRLTSHVRAGRGANGQGRGPAKGRGKRTAAPATTWGCAEPTNCLVQQAVAGLALGFVLIDPRGRLVWLNRAAERVLDLSAEASVGRSFKNLVHDPQLATFWQEAGCRDGHCMRDVTLQWPRRVELKVNATVCVGADGREIGRALLFCDVTTDRSVKLELTKEVAHRLLDLAAVEENAGGPVASLTPAELRVLRLVGAGMSNDVIARKLSVAVSTVRSHVKSAYRKLGLHTRAEAVRFALRHHLG